MTKITCPSEMVGDQFDEYEPTDDDYLKTLDAYGHLLFCIGEEYADANEESQISICADYNVFINVNGEIVIAYHVVYDDDCAGFIDTVESGVFPVKDLGDLDKNTWCPIESHVDGANEGLMGNPEAQKLGCVGIGWEQIEKVQKRWTTDLIACVKRALKILETGEEIPEGPIR